MDALMIRDLPLTTAAELLALAPDVPADMTEAAVLEAIGSVLSAHGDDLTACLADLAGQYGDHPGEIAARMARATVYTARLCGVRL